MSHLEAGLLTFNMSVSLGADIGLIDSPQRQLSGEP
jgi:hypothetical protein